MRTKSCIHEVGRGHEARSRREPNRQSGLAQHNQVVPLITKAALSTLSIVHRMIRDSAHFDSNAAFETVKIGKREKIALVVDILAERLAAVELWRRLRGLDPLILGEESLRDESLDLSEETRLVALLDMVDGTDLLERGLGNWCSAATFYLPAERQILGAFVAVPEGYIYFWTVDTPVPQKFNIKSGRTEPISGPSDVRVVSEASIAFYGQKMVNFCSCAGELAHEQNRNLLAKGLATRIYNLAGIPMMMKVVDGSGHKRIDAVFELLGQNPHDVVPGAVIVQGAGATVLGLDGASLDLVSALLRPSDPSRRLRYVLAATPELGAELLECLINRQVSLDHGKIAA